MRPVVGCDRTWVEAGQTLAVFDNIEAGELLSQEQSARADLERLKAQLIPASRQTERSRRLADIGAGAEKDYESSQSEKEGRVSGVARTSTVMLTRRPINTARMRSVYNRKWLMANG